MRADTRFSNQLLALFSAVILVTLTAAMAATWQAANRTIRANAARSLDVAERVFREQLRENARQLSGRATVLAEDFGFRRAIATNEHETIISVLANHGERAGANLMLLLSPSGAIMESTHAVKGRDLAELVDATRLDAGDADFLLAEGEAFQIVLVPVKAPDLIAWAGLGYRVDTATAQALKKVALADISLVLHDGAEPPVLISTLPAALQHDAGVPRAEGLDDSLRAAQMLVRSFDLLDAGSQRMHVVMSVSLRDALAAYVPLRTQMMLIGLVGLLIAALIALLVARGVTLPIDTLMRAAARIARGDYREPIALSARNEFGVLAATFNDMQAAIDEREQRIRYQAQHDVLTRLPNREYLGTLIGARRLDAAAPHEYGIAVILVARLQQFADAYGVDWCDELLRVVAARLAGTLRRGDLIAQLSRDQFVLYCDELVADGVAAVADKIRAPLATPFVCSGIEVTLDVRMGFALSPRDGRDYTDLLRRANIALGRCGEGLQRFAIYQTGEDQRQLRQIRVTQRLQRAIGGGGLALHFQPKLDLRRNAVTQAEALLRWTDEELGPVYPDEFIPLAEQSGDISQLTDWVLRAACEQAREWRSRGFDIAVGVNLSARDFLQDGFVEKVAALATESGITPAQLVLEVTESATIVDPQRAIAYLEALRAKGFGLSMDDFGTGYSSLSQLKNLPLDELKIDKSFVLSLDKDADDRSIVRSTIDLGHNLGLRVVAEGVENAASLALLREMGCDAIQGYHLSKPLPAAAFEQWLVARREGDDAQG